MNSKCQICGEVISKYDLDLNSAGALVFHNKLICEDCQKEIAHVVVDGK